MKIKPEFYQRNMFSLRCTNRNIFLFLLTLIPAQGFSSPNIYTREKLDEYNINKVAVFVDVTQSEFQIDNNFMSRYARDSTSLSNNAY